MIKLNKERIKKRKKTHQCIQCMKKAEPIITYPAGDIMPPIIEYPVRCYACRQYQKRNRQKNLGVSGYVSGYVTT